MYNKILKLILIVCSVAMIFTACGKGDSKEQAGSGSTNQMDNPAKGDTIGVLKTSMGDVKFKLFPDKAPKAVENFTKLAEKGYYDGLIFHRVMNDFMIQGGDPEGTGRGGESIWGEPFEDEIDKSLHYFKGTMAMANSGPNTNGSQFFIVQKPQMTESDIESMKQNKFDDKLIDQYTKLGGAQWLEKDFAMPNGYVSTGYTIFGQVYEGIDIVDKIAAVKVNEAAKPEEDVKIIGIEITEYK